MANKLMTDKERKESFEENERIKGLSDSEREADIKSIKKDKREETSRANKKRDDLTGNKNRNAFGFNGIFGMLIATGLLLTVLVFLITWAIEVQKRESTHFYDPNPIVSSLDNIKMKSQDNAKFAFKDVEENKK